MSNLSNAISRIATIDQACAALRTDLAALNADQRVSFQNWVKQQEDLYVNQLNRIEFIFNLLDRMGKDPRDAWLVLGGGTQSTSDAALTGPGSPEDGTNLSEEQKKNMRLFGIHESSKTHQNTPGVTPG